MLPLQPLAQRHCVSCLQNVSSNDAQADESLYALSPTKWPRSRDSNYTDSTSPTAPKQPIKKLPATIDLPANATVEDVKKLIAKEAGFSDHNRIGLFYPSSRKTLKDRKALIAEDKEVAEAGEVLVKDLGMNA